MPDNNFEEDVRQKMEELRFVPSGDVWTKVEENIRQDRKRRRFLFWLPLTGLLIGGMIWFAWPTGNLDREAIAKSGTTSGSGTARNGSEAEESAAPVTGSGQPLAMDDAASNAGNAARTKQATGLQPAAVHSGAEKILSVPPKAETETTKEPISGKKREKVKSHVPVITSEAEYLASVSASTSAIDKNKNGNLSEKRSNAISGTSREMAAGRSASAGTNTKETGKKLSGKPDAFPENEDKLTNDQSAPEPPFMAKGDGNPAATSVDSATASAGHLVSESIKKKANKKSLPLNTGEKKSVVPDPKKHKIEWGVTASGGLSKQNEKNAIPSAVLNRAFINSTVYIIKSSELKTGPAFSAGVVASKQIGKTWRVQTGIQYAYFSSTLPNPGQYQNYSVNSSPASYNNGVGLNAFGAPISKNKSYTNRYQYFQIPVLLEKQLSVRLPLYVQAGASVGYLSGVHALIYQPLLDQYSKDDAEFNKLQVSGLAGVYWKFPLNDNWSLRAGPELQYQFTNLMKSSVSVNDHILTGGVRVILLHSGR